MSNKMTAYEASNEELLQTPQVKSRIRLWPYQWPGVIILLLIPILALFGIFGVTTKTVTETNNGIKAFIEYPTKLRHGQNHSIRVELTNMSNRALSDLVAKFNPDYIHRFSNVSFVPEPRQAYQVEVGGLAAGESRTVLVEFTADRYGYHNGQVTVSSGGTELLTSNVKTLVFP